MNSTDMIKNEILKKYSKLYSDGEDYTWMASYPHKSVTIDDVLKNFTPEQLIEAIGMDEVQRILRSKKLDILKKKLNK